MQNLNSKILRDARESLGLSQALLGREAGVAASAISMAEANLRDLSPAVTVRLCRFLSEQLAQRLGTHPPEMDTFRECVAGVQLLLAQAQICQAMDTLDGVQPQAGA